jgi:hypothetical protein
MRFGVNQMASAILERMTQKHDLELAIQFDSACPACRQSRNRVEGRQRWMTVASQPPFRPPAKDVAAEALDAARRFARMKHSGQSSDRTTRVRRVRFDQKPIRVNQPPNRPEVRRMT